MGTNGGEVGRGGSIELCSEESDLLTMELHQPCDKQTGEVFGFNGFVLVPPSSFSAASTACECCKEQASSLLTSTARGSAGWPDVVFLPRPENPLEYVLTMLSPESHTRVTHQNCE